MYSADGRSWTSYGNTTLGYDGGRYTRYGDTTIGSDGQTWRRHGDVTAGSSGETWTTIGCMSSSSRRYSCPLIVKDYFCGQQPVCRSAGRPAAGTQAYPSSRRRRTTAPLPSVW